MSLDSVSSLRVGIAGLGTVGATVARHLLDGAVSNVVVTRVSARDASKDRGFDMQNSDMSGM